MKTGYVVALAMLGGMGIGAVSVPVARADELKVLSAGIMHFALKDVGDNFTGKTGTKLAITFGNAGRVKTELEKGEPADVAILPKPDAAALANAGKIVPDSLHDIARTALALSLIHI